VKPTFDRAPLRPELSEYVGVTSARMTVPSRANVLGVGVHALNLNSTLDLMESAIVSATKGYVCLTNVHCIIEARKNPNYRSVLNNSFLTVPDGRPTVWVGHTQGLKAMDQVTGPELMLKFCEISCRKGYSNFFYGGRPGVAEQLKASFTSRFPGLNVVGTYCPPFRPLNTEEQSDLRKLFARLKPDITWVGLGGPKQDLFMAEQLEKLDTTVMVGVGAVFDVYTGRIKDPPQWMKRAGLAWLHRLGQEPRRLWKRYLITNTRFLGEIVLQLLKLRTYDLDVLAGYE
jgi:N-acetylglucosaminyldiphosphoundecaprenol N-acetyl-beta-D-mannosaminyltransferase